MIKIPNAALEAGARAAMRAVELEHGSPEGRKLLGFDTSAAFIDAGWPNYVEQIRAAFVAMVEAWEGMKACEEDDLGPACLILPLPPPPAGEQE